MDVGLRNTLIAKTTLRDKILTRVGLVKTAIEEALPTTKFCPQCEKLNSISLSERIYKCNCGYEFDRDVHAARNIKKFGSLKRAECLEQASLESKTSKAIDSSVGLGFDVEEKNKKMLRLLA